MSSQHVELFLQHTHTRVVPSACARILAMSLNTLLAAKKNFSRDQKEQVASCRAPRAVTGWLYVPRVVAGADLQMIEKTPAAHGEAAPSAFTSPEK